MDEVCLALQYGQRAWCCFRRDLDGAVAVSHPLAGSGDCCQYSQHRDLVRRNHVSF